MVLPKTQMLKRMTQARRSMQIYTFVSASLFACILLTNCATAVRVETSGAIGGSRYKTYQWVTTEASQQNSNSQGAFSEQTVRNAANRVLQQKGLREDTLQPDLLIAYDILVERSRERRSDPVYSQPFTRYYYNPYFRRWGRVYYPSSFLGYDTYTVPVKEGTVTITMLDAASDKVVWQAWAMEELDSRRFRSAELEKTVEAIVGKLKIDPSGTNSAAGN